MCCMRSLSYTVQTRRQCHPRDRRTVSRTLGAGEKASGRLEASECGSSKSKVTSAAKCFDPNQMHGLDRHPVARAARVKEQADRPAGLWARGMRAPRPGARDGATMSALYNLERVTP